MLQDLDESLKALLVEQLPIINERIGSDGFDVRFEAPTREFNSKRGGKATLSVYLYNIQENRHLRGRIWDRRFEEGVFYDYRPDVKLDCSYIVTAWANEVEDEHRLLAGAARAFFRNPALCFKYLRGELKRCALEVAGKEDAADADTDDVASSVTTEVAQPESFKDAIDIWSVLDGDLKPSLRVTVTVPLDLNVPRPDAEGAPPVTQLPDIQVEVIEARPLASRTTITGHVRRAGNPVAGAVVRVGHSTSVTDYDGRYTLRDIARPSTEQVMDDPDEAGKLAVLVAAERQLYLREQDLARDPTIELEEGDGPKGGGPDPDGRGGRGRRPPRKNA
jgi:hypothetical protein